jgi:DNA primase
MNDVEAVKSRINIVELVSEKVRLKKSGANYFGLCPFHSEKSPSFSVNENLQIFKCFGCGEQGDALAFLMKTENFEFREALEELAEKVGYKLSASSHNTNDKEAEEIKRLLAINKYASEYFQKKLLDGDNPGIQYAQKRGLNNELIKKFGIGYASDSYQELTTILNQKKVDSQSLVKYGLSVDREGRINDKFRNRLIFTIYDEKGKVVGFSGRNLIPDDPNASFKIPKYLNSPETLVFKKSKLLFGLYQAQEAIRKLNFAILSEGQMNIISSHKVGVHNIVASLGTSFTDLHMKLLSRYSSNVYFAFDKDTAGKKALLRTLEMAFKFDINAKVVHWDPRLGKDPDEVIAKNPNYWIEAVNKPIDPIEFIFNEFDSKLGTTNIDHVNSFLKVVLPLIAAHKNEVKKEFYLKYLADHLGLPVAAIQDSLRKGQPVVRQKEPEKKINDDKELKKYDVTIFDKIFALIIQNWSSVKHMILALERDYMPEKYSDLYDCLFLFTDIDDVKEVRENLDEQTVDIFDTLMLLNVLVDESVSPEEHIMKMLPISKDQYKKILLSLWKRNPEDPELSEKATRILKSH